MLGYPSFKVELVSIHHAMNMTCSWASTKSGTYMNSYGITTYRNTISVSLNTVWVHLQHSQRWKTGEGPLVRDLFQFYRRCSSQSAIQSEINVVSVRLLKSADNHVSDILAWQTTIVPKILQRCVTCLDFCARHKTQIRTRFCSLFAFSNPYMSSFYIDYKSNISNASG